MGCYRPKGVINHKYCTEVEIGSYKILQVEEKGAYR